MDKRRLDHRTKALTVFVYVADRSLTVAVLIDGAESRTVLWYG